MKEDDRKCAEKLLKGVVSLVKELDSMKKLTMGGARWTCNSQREDTQSLARTDNDLAQCG